MADQNQVGALFSSILAPSVATETSPYVLPKNSRAPSDEDFSQKLLENRNAKEKKEVDSSPESKSRRSITSESASAESNSEQRSRTREPQRTSRSEQQQTRAQRGASRDSIQSTPSPETQSSNLREADSPQRDQPAVSEAEPFSQTVDEASPIQDSQEVSPEQLAQANGGETKVTEQPVSIPTGLSEFFSFSETESQAEAHGFAESSITGETETAEQGASTIPPSLASLLTTGQQAQSETDSQNQPTLPELVGGVEEEQVPAPTASLQQPGSLAAEQGLETGQASTLPGSNPEPLAVPVAEPAEGAPESTEDSVIQSGFTKSVEASTLQQSATQAATPEPAASAPENSEEVPAESENESSQLGIPEHARRTGSPHGLSPAATSPRTPTQAMTQSDPVTSVVPAGQTTNPSTVSEGGTRISQPLNSVSPVELGGLQTAKASPSASTANSSQAISVDDPEFPNRISQLLQHAQTTGKSLKIRLHPPNWERCRSKSPVSKVRLWLAWRPNRRSLIPY